MPRFRYATRARNLPSARKSASSRRNIRKAQMVRMARSGGRGTQRMRRR